jgi:hypothetical protein
VELPLPEEVAENRERAARDREGIAAWLVRVAPALLCCLVTLAVYAQIVRHEFVWLDDDVTLIANARFNPATWRGIGWYWAHGDPGLWIPVTYTVLGALAMTSRGGSLDPRVFHGASVIGHTGGVLIAYLLLRRLLNAPGRGGKSCGAGMTDVAWPAAVGALAYALHPLGVEGVAWASTLKAERATAALVARYRGPVHA